MASSGTNVTRAPRNRGAAPPAAAWMRQPGLAGATRTRERDEPGLLEHLRDGRHLRATDERRHRRGHPRADRLQRPQRGERGAETSTRELEDAQRSSEVLQAVLTEVLEVETDGQDVAHRSGRGRREQHLPAVPRSRDPGGLVERQAHVVVPGASLRGSVGGRYRVAHRVRSSPAVRVLATGGP